MSQFANQSLPKSYEEIESIANWLKDKTTHRPKVGIVLGSGLGGVAECIQDAVPIPYKDIPNFPRTTVEGHAGTLIFGNLSGVPVVVMQGRFHFYEGHSMHTLATPIRTMKLLGVQILVLSNAAGGVNETYRVGDIMFLKDHAAFALMHDNPLRGPNDPRFGPRFISLYNCYCPKLRSIAKQTSKQFESRGRFHEGVYFLQPGPHYETVAELKSIRDNHSDAIGMSTAPETMVARHCGMRVFAFSLITNNAVFDYEAKKSVDHEEVLEASNNYEPLVKDFLMAVVKQFEAELK